MSKDPNLYLVHIRDCCRRVLRYTAPSGESWMVSELVLDAVCRNLEIIGEAANKLGEEFRSAHHEIPWRGMIDARNILIHAYDQVRAPLLEDVVANDIPVLLAQVEALLAKPGK